MPDLLGKFIDLLKISLYVTVVIGLPGLIIQRLCLWRKLYLSETIGFTFALGSGIFVPFAIICFFLKANLTTAIFTYAVLVFTLAILTIKTLGKHRFFCIIKKPTRFDLLFFSFLLIVTYLFRHLVHFGLTYTADYWYHLAQIRYFVDMGTAQNIFPFFQQEIPQWMYPFNSYYVLLAMAAKATHTDVIRVWMAMRFILLYVLLSNILLFFRLLLSNEKKAILATFFLFLSALYIPMESGIGGFTVFTHICYPKVGSLWIFMPALSVCLLFFLQNGKIRSGLLAGTIIALAFQNWHVVNAMFIIIITTAWLLGFIIARQYHHTKRLLLFTAVTCLLPFISYYYLDHRLIHPAKETFEFNAHYLNPAWYGASKILHRLDGNWFITKPSYYFTFASKAVLPWMVMSVFVLPAAIWAYRKNKWAYPFLIGFTVLPVLLAYNPLTVTLMVKYGAPFLVRRFLFIIPIGYAAGLFLLSIADRLIAEHKQAHMKRYAIVVAIFFGLIFLFPIFKHHSARQYFNPNPVPEIFELKTKIENYVPTGATILSDVKTSQVLGALKWVRVVTSSKHLMVSMSENHASKVEDLNAFFSSKSSPSNRSLIAEKYGANHVVVQKKLIENIKIDGFDKIFENKEFELWEKHAKNF